MLWYHDTFFRHVVQPVSRITSRLSNSRLVQATQVFLYCVQRCCSSGKCAAVISLEEKLPIFLIRLINYRRLLNHQINQWLIELSDQINSLVNRIKKSSHGIIYYENNCEMQPQNLLPHSYGHWLALIAQNDALKTAFNTAASRIRRDFSVSSHAAANAAAC